MATIASKLEDDDIWNNLSTEQQVVAKSLIDEFKSQGLCLKQNNREKFFNVQRKIANYINNTERLMYSSNSTSHIVDEFKRIVDARHELASLLEFPSYADMMMKSRYYFTHPEEVNQFLCELGDAVNESEKENTIIDNIKINSLFASPERVCILLRKIILGIKF